MLGLFFCLQREIAMKKMFAVLAAIFLLAVIACTPGGWGDSKATATIQGWVYADKPISGATLTIYNIKGEQVSKTDKSATGDLGSFLITVYNLPSDFRILADNGRHEGQAFEANLSADFRNCDPQNDIIYINVVTTMVSTYLDQHPEKTLNKATAAVKKFLEIPDEVDIGSGLHGSGEYFDYGKFLEEAANHGGVNNYIEQLVKEIDGNATHPFPGLPTLSDEESIGVWAAKQLASGALSYVGGKLMGWGLSEIGIGFGGESDESIKEMQTKLVEISQQLDALDTKMTQFYDELSYQITQNNYDVRMGQMGTLISNIKSIRQKIAIYISNPPADPTLLETKKKEIIKLIEERLVGNETVIHDQLTGLNGQTPLLKVWSQVVKTKHRFLSSNDSSCIKPQFDYFDMLQIWMMELLVEYYHAIGEGEAYHADIDSVIQDYTNHIAAQRALLLPSIPDRVYIDRDKGLMISLPDNAMIDFYNCNKIICDMKYNQSFGLSGWRWPTKNEMVAFFAGWTGSPWQYVQSQGFSGIVVGRYYGAAEYDPNVLIWAGYNYYVWYYDSTAGTINSEYYMDRDRIITTMAVRTMTTGELGKYFW